MAGNLGLLGANHYHDILDDCGVGMLHLLGLDVAQRTLGLILPVGISFYTFQTLSYTIDVYRRRLTPIESLRDFALFVSFFPQLVAGPIVRATEFLPQLDERRTWDDVRVRASLWIFLCGFVKKAVVSDNLAPITDQVFADPAAFTAGSNWLCLLLWHVRIYCDFSGYSDMAIGTAGLLGYRLPKNFDFPYFAHNIAEFWRRWHITLSTWFRDYLYVSLGGSRSGGARALMAGTLTMLLCGLWHGAGWQYVGFGLLMSAAVIVERLWSSALPAESAPRRLVHALGPAILWWFLFLNWIVFRAESWETCRAMLAAFFFLDGGGTRTLETSWLLVALAFLAVHTLLWLRPFERRALAVSDWTFAAFWGAAAACALLFVSAEYRPFVYFQF
jgi:alginate O-acetyltransferase complex protein AlgI